MSETEDCGLWCYTVAIVFILWILFIVLYLMGLGIYKCWHYFSPNGLTRERREKEASARTRMEEYHKKQQQKLKGQEACCTIYEIGYSGSMIGRGDGYGHGELHIYISSKPDINGFRRISGCGMRQLTYTEIIEGHVNAEGNAVWTEQTIREISYSPPRGSTTEDRHSFFKIDGEYSLDEDLTSHWGPASIVTVGTFSSDMQSLLEGRFFGRDECNCMWCHHFWTIWSDKTNIMAADGFEDGTFIKPKRGQPLPMRYEPRKKLHEETLRWTPAAERRKIGDYFLFRAKKEKTARTEECADGEDQHYHRMDLEQIV